MSSYVISCCSTADLTEEHFSKREISYICFHYKLNDTEYADDLGKSMPFDQFYAAMAAGASTKTSQVNADEFEAYFETFLQDGKDILHVCLSSGISGVLNSAMIAKADLEERYPERKILIVDSLGASSGYGLLMDRLADLRDAERKFHAARFLDVEEVDEDALRRFGTQVDRVGPFGRRPHLGGEHQVELPHLRPVARARNGAGDLAVEDDLPQSAQVVGVHRLGETGVYLVASGGRLGDAGRRGAVFLLVERLAEALAGLFDLLFDLLVLFGDPLLDEYVGAVTFLRILVVDQRIVEGRNVSRSLPCAGVHEDRGVDTHDVFVELDHRIPPVALDVVLQLDAVLTVVVDGAQTVVDLARREDEAVLLAVGHEFLEKFVLCHSRMSYFVLQIVPIGKDTKSRAQKQAKVRLCRNGMPETELEIANCSRWGGIRIVKSRSGAGFVLRHVFCVLTGNIIL